MIEDTCIIKYQSTTYQEVIFVLEYAKNNPIKTVIGIIGFALGLFITFN